MKKLYRSFLLRIWRMNEGQLDVWRFSLEDPGTRKRIGFSDLEKLTDYLRRSIAELDSKSGA